MGWVVAAPRALEPLGLTLLEELGYVQAKVSEGSKRLFEITDTVGPPPFYDVSGDNSVTALDAVLVINRLNAGGSGEESPPAPPAPPASATSGSTRLFRHSGCWPACLLPTGSTRLSRIVSVKRSSGSG